MSRDCGSFFCVVVICIDLMGKPRKKRYSKVKRRPGGRMDRLERLLLPYARHNRGTPMTFAIAMSAAMGEVVTNKEVWKVLRENNLLMKKPSVVPGFAIEQERQQYLKELKQVWRVTNQALFLDEKKFKLGELINRGFGGRVLTNWNSFTTCNVNNPKLSPNYAQGS